MEEEQKMIVLSEELTDEAVELILRCPHIINRLAQSLNNLIDNWDVCDTPLEPIEISHVSYTPDECGYEK